MNFNTQERAITFIITYLYNKVLNEKTIGDKIRKIRRESGLKQVEFVAALDIDRSYLSKIESNRIKPGRDLLIKIAKEFNVSLDWLITDTDDTSTPKK